MLHSQRNKGCEGSELSEWRRMNCADVAVTCKLLRERSYFFAGSAPMQRIALGWQATPILEHAGPSPSAPREQLTQSSVHRLQFGGPFCIETFSAG
jgi:hypothetical protein